MNKELNETEPRLWILSGDMTMETPPVYPPKLHPYTPRNSTRIPSKLHPYTPRNSTRIDPSTGGVELYWSSTGGVQVELNSTGEFLLVEFY